MVKAILDKKEAKCGQLKMPFITVVFPSPNIKRKNYKRRFKTYTDKKKNRN